MLTSIVLAALAATAPAQARADTVVPVDRGARLEVENFRGEVVIEAWSRDAVRITGEDDEVAGLEVERAGSVLRVRNRPGGRPPAPPSPGERRGERPLVPPSLRALVPGDADLHLSVPAWMDVHVRGNQLDVAVRGTQAGITVETVSGDVFVDGGARRVTVHTIKGDVDVRNARGELDIMSVNDDVSLRNIDAETLRVQTTNGDVSMSAVRSGNVRAGTVNGDLRYAGAIAREGSYRFATHNGDLELIVPRDADAAVSVTSYRGEFRTDFPVAVSMTGGGQRSFSFTLGSGRARVEMESFNGDIHLRRAP